MSYVILIDKLGNTSVGQTHKTDLTYYVLKYIFWTYMEIHNGCSETAKALISLPSNCLLTLTASISALLIASYRSYYRRPGLDVRICYLLTTLYGLTTTVLFEGFNFILLDFIFNCIHVDLKLVPFLPCSQYCFNCVSTN